MLLAHDVPGRLRLIVPGIKGNRYGAAALQNQASALNNVTQATANSLTGSLIIHYDGGLPARASILRHIRSLEQDVQEQNFAAERNAITVSAYQARGIADLAAEAIANWLVERAVQLALATLD